jgi:hypothetical protein
MTQSSYDYYNNFIFDKNTSIFHKMASRIEFFNRVRNVPGDIIECGVFKGAGVALWGKLLVMNSPHDSRKVLGFDFFSRNTCIDSMENDQETKSMEKVFSRCEPQDSEISVEGVTSSLLKSGIPRHKFELVPGNLTQTSRQIVEDKPGLRIALLYMDVDVEEPTYAALNAFWDRLSIGGIIVFDEYAVHAWSEACAVDRFIKEKGLRLHKTNVVAPTAYVIKTRSKHTD